MAKKNSKIKLEDGKGTKMILHEAIKKVLFNENKELNTKQITEKINEQNLDKRKDGRPLLTNQINARVRNYPSLFYVANNLIGLNIWGNKKRQKKSLLTKGIEFILEENEGSLSIQIITDTINKRNEYLDDFEKNFSIEQILEEVKKNNQIFRLNNEKVELHWEYDEYEGMVRGLDFAEIYLAKQKIKVKEIENSIKSISVANFKSYNKLQELELKPITLLFGPNSSGKSSLIHSILYLQNAFDRKDLDPKNMKIGGTSVELGGFKQLIHKHNFKRELKFSLKIDKTKLSETLKNYFDKIKEIKLNIEISQTLKAIERKQVVKADGEESLD